MSLIGSLLIVAGCSTGTPNTQIQNTNINTDNITTDQIEINANTNKSITNEDTDTNSTTVVEESNWQTYANEQSGFTVQYPADWGIISSKDDTEFFITYKLPSWKHQDFPPGINIDVAVKDIDKQWARYKKESPTEAVDTLDGYTSYSYDYVEIISEKVIIIPDRQTIIKLRADDDFKVSSEYQQIYDSIQFLN